MPIDSGAAARAANQQHAAMLQQRMMDEMHEMRQRAAAQAAADVGISHSAAMAAMPLLPDMQTNSQGAYAMSAVAPLVRCCPWPYAAPQRPALRVPANLTLYSFDLPGDGEHGVLRGGQRRRRGVGARHGDRRHGRRGHGRDGAAGRAVLHVHRLPQGFQARDELNFSCKARPPVFIHVCRRIYMFMCVYIYIYIYMYIFK